MTKANRSPNTAPFARHVWMASKKPTSSRPGRELHRGRRHDPESAVASPAARRCAMDELPSTSRPRCTRHRERVLRPCAQRRFRVFQPAQELAELETWLATTGPTRRVQRRFVVGQRSLERRQHRHFFPTPFAVSMRSASSDIERMAGHRRNIGAPRGCERFGSPSDYIAMRSRRGLRRHSVVVALVACGRSRSRRAERQADPAKQPRSSRGDQAEHATEASFVGPTHLVLASSITPITPPEPECVARGSNEVEPSAAPIERISRG